eukprot:7471837-Pyramimonas_sp.AAC.1
MRRTAGVICGRSASSTSPALELPTQKDEMYDPVFHATLEPVKAYASFVWNERVSMGRLQRAWVSVNEQM